METLFETPNLTLDYHSSRQDDSEAFRLTLYDKYGHYGEELYLNPRQVKELKEGLEEINLNEIDERFDDEEEF